MEKVFQTRFGLEGNCIEACIASIFDLKIENVPNLCDNGEKENGKWFITLNKWLSDNYNLNYFEIGLREEQKDLFFKGTNFYHTISVKSDPDVDFGHSLVGLKGEKVHDPEPNPFKHFPYQEGCLSVGLFVRKFI